MPDSRPSTSSLVEPANRSASVRTDTLRENSCRTGALTLILGCMFSGKSTRLLDTLRDPSKGAFLLFKHRMDRRYAVDAVVTHARDSLPAIAVAEPAEVLNWVKRETAVVGIDEAHFFPLDLLDVIHELLGRGVDVLGTALDRNSWGRSIAVVEALRPLASRVDLLAAVCGRCGRIASRTQRTTPIRGTLVGGPESYEPRCDLCWTPPPEPVPLE